MASDTGDASRRFTFTLADTSPRPDELPSTKRLAVRIGFSSVPAKKCGGAPETPNGTMVALLVPRSDVCTKGTTTPRSIRSFTP